MTTRAQLEALVERVRGATGPDREIEADVYVAIFDDGGWVGGNWYVARSDDGSMGSSRVIALPAYTASLDAVVALIERELPNYNVSMFSDCGAYFARVEHFDTEWHYISGFDGAGVDRESWCLAAIDAFLSAKLSSLPEEA